MISWSRQDIPEVSNLLVENFLPIAAANEVSSSSIVIDHFKAQIPKSGYGIAHVYFDYKEQDQQTPTYVLASLVKQLLRQISYLPTEIEALYDTLKTKDRRPTLDELYSALLVAKECFPRVFLIFDALDECNPEKQRKPLLPLFHRMGRDSMSLFLTSRPHPEDIRDSLTGYDDATSIELAAQDEDMVAYTQEKIKENPRAKRLIKQGKCQDRIISSLVDCAEGMCVLRSLLAEFYVPGLTRRRFLLVRFHVEYLCRQTSAKQILTELDRLSTGKGSLDPTYDRAMEDLRGQPKNYVELAFKVLCWLVKSRRTLTVDEILVAVSVEPNRYELDELDLPDTAILLDVCAGLVVIDKDTNIIRLAHYTVQEYLIRNSLLQHTEFHLAMVCTTYLSFDVFKTGPSTTYEAFEDRTQSHPLFTYAVSHLLPHLKACNENQTTDMILKFLSCPGSISVYLEGCDIKEGYSWTRSLVNLDPYSPLIDFLSLPLHWASSLGHHAVISQLLNEGVDLSLVDDDGSTALHLATSAGYGNVVQTLLEKGADHAIRDNNGKTALHYAASKTGKEMIRILLKSGADPSICDSSGRTALHLAVIGGDEVIARMLLENEVDHSVVDEFWKTALHYAMEKGHEVIVGMLLENGADHSIPNLSGQTVLHLASTARHKHIVKALLLRGASHSIPDSYGQTALHFASSAGFKDVAQLLLKNGAGHWTQDNSGKTALHFASIAGCKDIAQLLLENGADHWIPDNSGKTALHSASFAGFKGVVQVLPQNGAQHLAQDDTGDTALHLASRAEREDVVQTLLENGADHSIPNGNGRTALHLASLAGYNGIVQTLLDNGGYHWIPDNKGKTPLHLASLAGCKDVVQTLLGNGASHMTLNDDGKSALDYALLGGHEAISQMLLGGGGEN